MMEIKSIQTSHGAAMLISLGCPPISTPIDAKGWGVVLLDGDRASALTVMREIENAQWIADWEHHRASAIARWSGIPDLRVGDEIAVDSLKAAIAVCPGCGSSEYKKNGRVGARKTQQFMCKRCKKQWLADASPRGGARRGEAWDTLKESRPSK